VRCWIVKFGVTKHARPADADCYRMHLNHNVGQNVMEGYGSCSSVRPFSIDSSKEWTQSICESPGTRPGTLRCILGQFAGLSSLVKLCAAGSGHPRLNLPQNWAKEIIRSGAVRACPGGATGRGGYMKTFRIKWRDNELAWSAADCWSTGQRKPDVRSLSTDLAKPFAYVTWVHT
jgi:hypothetical protein